MDTPPGRRVAPYQADHVLNEGIDVERSLVRVVLFEEGPQAVDHIDGSLVVGHDVGDDLAKILGIDAAVDQSLGDLRVTQDGRERLVQLVGDRRRQLTHRRHATHVGEVAA